MVGVILIHPSKRNVVYPVENIKRPFGDGGYICNVCHVHHKFKTTHLWLNDAGSCVVSTGVLEELRLAGGGNMTVFGHTTQPPPIKIGRGNTREKVDNENRRIVVLPSIQRFTRSLN
jgi:hypothetical protein